MFDHRSGIGAKGSQRCVQASTALAVSALIIGDRQKATLCEWLHDLVPHSSPLSTGMKEKRRRPTSQLIETKNGIRPDQRIIDHKKFLTSTDQGKLKP
nr:hypothetical protein [Sphingomonas alpina]